MRNREFLFIAGIGLAAFLAWKFFRKKIEAGADTIAEAIANPIIAATLPAPINVNGSAILPNGLKIPFTSLHVVKTPNKEEFTFTYLNKRYALLPRDANGNYSTRAL